MRGSQLIGLSRAHVIAAFTAMRGGLTAEEYHWDFLRDRFGPRPKVDPSQQSIQKGGEYFSSTQITLLPPACAHPPGTLGRLGYHPK
jgi:hypothetical protein